MDAETALQNVKHHNNWRVTGEGEMLDPYVITDSINIVVAELEGLKDKTKAVADFAVSDATAIVKTTKEVNRGRT